MAKNKKMVAAITSMDEDFAQWFTDVCIKAELIDYSSIKGFTIMRPYGQALWENIQKIMDAKFKAENAIPNMAGAALLGKLAAEAAKAAGIEEVVFDRSGYRYHGRIKAVADAARENGLKF